MRMSQRQNQNKQQFKHLNNKNYELSSNKTKRRFSKQVQTEELVKR
jgi:hypothetical protein